MSTGGYYDIDSILSEEVRVPCTFTLDAIGMGVLDPTTSDEDLSQGAKVDFPLWMARPLAGKGMVDLDLPKHYTEKFREQLEAGPGAINLRDRCPFYYEVGVSLASLTGDQRLQDTLLMVFSGERFKRLLDCSLNSLNEDVNSFTRDLPNLEKSLFNSGYRSSEEYVGWKSRAFNKLAMSKVIQGKVKRQRI
ncbi:unnamed protein product [Hapterophycus canaliculatus]